MHAEVRDPCQCGPRHCEWRQRMHRARLGTSSEFSNTSRVQARACWAAGLLGLGACGEFPEPAWLLTAEPRVLAFRVDVVEPGPLSYGFLPIPADRVRSQPLPGDTVDVSAWVVVGEREVPTPEVDPAWFLCPRSSRCVSTLGRAKAAEPCVGVVPEDVACRLPDGEQPRFVVPALDPLRPLEDQTWFRVAMVGHVDDRMTTADCIELVSDPSVADWSGCLVGYRGITLGPALRLVLHAIEVGSEVSEALEHTRDEPVSPPFNPEVVPLKLFPYYENRQPDESRSITVKPEETAVLEPDTVYIARGAWDTKDVQSVQEVDEFEFAGLSEEVSFPRRSLFSSAPEILEYSLEDGWQIWTPEDPASFEIRLVLSDRAGGAAWASFNFEVSAP